MPENLQVVFAVSVFFITYAIIVSEKIHRSIIALSGAFLMVVFGILSHEKAIAAIDFNVIGLLVGMMLIVGIIKDTGIFEYLAVSIAKAAKGRPVVILAALAMLGALLSGILDNVTLILLIVPVTISIARLLGISPIPLVISEVLLSNIGGAATLIGDPPNIIIGSAAELGFMDFVINLGPVLLVIAVVTTALLAVAYRRKLKVDDEHRQRLMEIDAAKQIKSKPLAIKSLAVMGLVIVGFITHQLLHLESATIAMAGASLLLLLVRPNVDKTFRHVEWPVIFFFVGLFILVGGLQAVGAIKWLAQQVVGLTGGELLPSGLAILWFAGFASGFVDNIPFTATMVPIIQEMGGLTAMQDLAPLWWSLALGACLGGNATIVGASANVVAIGMLDEKGMRVSFLQFMAIGLPLTLLALLISSIYLYVFYLT
ncbi:MAG: ArsB/NhaD family transporter [Actinomycetia bacterium]|nr:ArsB/NhaD family transporter [Actinomycetes bacterium]